MQNVEIDPNKQYILAGDISASMQTKDPLCSGLTRYEYQLEKFENFIGEATKFDPDGPTVIQFGEKVHVFENTTLDAVKPKLGAPAFENCTMTDLAIEKAWELHKAQKAELAAQGKSHPGTVLFLFTDGAPTARKGVEDVIRKISNAIDRDEEFSIGFLTVGTIEPALQDYLTGLDDNLKGAKFDIVDVKALNEVTFLAAVDGAMNN